MESSPGGPERQWPRNSPLTLALLVLWVILAIYIVWTGNTLGYIILALVSLFVFLPALVLWLAMRRASMAEPGNDQEPPDDETAHGEGDRGDAEGSA